MTKGWVSNWTKWTRLLLSLFNMQKYKNKEFTTKNYRSIWHENEERKHIFTVSFLRYWQGYTACLENSVLWLPPTLASHASKDGITLALLLGSTGYEVNFNICLQCVICVSPEVQLPQSFSLHSEHGDGASHISTCVWMTEELYTSSIMAKIQTSSYNLFSLPITSCVCTEYLKSRQWRCLTHLYM